MIRLLIVIVLAFASTTSAKLVTRDVEYRDGDTLLRGYLAYDDAIESAPGVVIYPEWWGLNDYVKRRAREVAGLGYVAFAADMHGAGKVTDNPAKAAEMTGAVKANNALYRRRAITALATLQAQPMVDKSRLAVMGYCFGGSTALEVARAGEAVRAVVSFHGGLDTPEPARERPFPPVLILHGAADPMVPPEQVLEFMREMDFVGADWQLIAYGGALHAFTNPDADRHNLPPVKYDQKADMRSWEAMKAFFSEHLE